MTVLSVADGDMNNYWNEKKFFVSNTSTGEYALSLAVMFAKCVTWVKISN